MQNTSILEENRSKFLFEISPENEPSYHHTFKDEQILLSCVREGRGRDAINQCTLVDSKINPMAKNEYSHWYKLTIISITLCTRAAIEGGLSPSKAYTISDYYLNKMDSCNTIQTLIVCRDDAIMELSNLVKMRQENHRSSSYVEMSKDYINKNYMNKFHIGDIAESLGINESYLSRIFSKETGTTLQDYINMIRIDRASNLLIYSEVSLSQISDYVGFVSQSYFGKIFLRFKGMTPRQFREKNKPAEFISAGL